MSNKKYLSYAGIFVFVFLAVNPAFADLQGGLGEVQSNMETIKKWLITLSAIGAVIYIMWKGLETWRSRGDWGDFGIACGYAALVGAAPAIADWAFSVFA